ncbi:SMP-30/gluconolactonase/LRE family protein [Brevundimonas sp.]|uniref:SMP-30/gluconolactonase/LRE family protein n=1 Tax=Brevundimonas sp. TaxID=1871086 RepID=UPI002737ABEA|nr:hypothetical protein [Brevundimonas sp.]MDP3803440.1 hypothetical protein [Brevundimonas sp.]
MGGWAATAAGLVLAFGAGAAAAQSPETLVTTPSEPLLIESVARGADGGLILSSIHKARLMRVGADGALTPFGPEDRQAMFGLAADPARGDLWVASSPSPADERTDGPAELIRIDAATGAVRAAHAADGLEHAYGDVAVGPDGTVFVADSKGRRILALRPGAANPEPLALLSGQGSPQGMAVSADGRWLVFADYRSGLHRIDLSEGYAARDFTAAPPPALPGPEGAELRGIDGLARHGDHIIAIQNGTRTHRVLRLTLNADWSAVTARDPVIEGPPLEEPTTGFVEGDSLVFVSRSQWTDFGPDGRPTTATPAPAVVSRLSLSPEPLP